MKKNRSDNLVYSTESGKLCPGCQQAIAQCSCKADTAKQIIGDGTVRISRETKGRKGKGVTLISGLAVDAKELKNIAKNLKQLCGTGGAVKDGVIEIQGDKRDVIFESLKKQGYQVKRAGG